MENAATVLWGVKEGDEDWMETILSTQPERFEAVKAMAARDGWGRFRVATIDLTTTPDFTKAVKASPKRRRSSLSGLDPGAWVEVKFPPGVRYFSGGRRADVWLSAVDGWYHWTVKNSVTGGYDAYGKERSEADARAVALKAIDLPHA